MIRSATIFALENHIGLTELREMKRWAPPQPDALGSIGIVPTHGEYGLALGNEGVWIQIRISTKKIPPSEIARQMEESAHGLRGRAKLEARDKIVTALCEDTPPAHKNYNILLRPGYLIIGTSTPKTVDDLTVWLRNQLGALAIKPLQQESGELRHAIRSLLEAKGLSVDNLSICGGVHIKGEFSEVVAKGDLTMHDELLDHLRQTAGEGVKKANIEWGDFSATVNDKWALSSIRSDFEIDVEDTEDPSAHDRAVALYFCTQLPRLLTDIQIHSAGQS